MNEKISEALAKALENISSAINTAIIEMKDWFKPRTIFALMFYGTLCYLILKQLPVPEVLKQIVSFLMGFYFGQKMPEQKKEEK